MTSEMERVLRIKLDSIGLELVESGAGYKVWSPADKKYVKPDGIVEVYELVFWYETYFKMPQWHLIVTRDESKNWTIAKSGTQQEMNELRDSYLNEGWNAADVKVRS